MPTLVGSANDSVQREQETTATPEVPPPTKRRRNNNGSSTGSSSSNSRVILLLDLDCFYAQAACLRLGWSAETTALALFQWNSVLAVTYPARKRHGIQRGDSWEAVYQKSNGRCYGVHVPILTTDDSTGDSSATTNIQCASTKDGGASSSLPSTTSLALSVTPSLHEEYDRLFVMSKEDQETARREELGVRKYSHQGKACIECFRIASARIFDTVRRHLDEAELTVTLERASIDEFFLDVTAAVDNDETVIDLTESTKRTVIIGKDKSNQCTAQTGEERGDEGGFVHTPDDDDTQLRLQRGCAIAYHIRKAVYDQLGFTMSAGIGHNKTVAKLAASYGKPAGQAVCFPAAVASMLNETSIRSCRNLGGKLGSSVQNLLPSGVPNTVGSIARYLSLPDLQQALKDNATALWVYDICRGIDREAVEAKTQTSAVLTKSITAFKSLNFSPDSRVGGVVGHSLAEASRWIQLLAQEVVCRVERDASRNDRYPRTCNIQYAAAQSQPNYTNNKSIRIPFPASRLAAAQKVAQLVSAVPKAIRSKEDEVKKTKVLFRMHRIGLCATDFESRAACSNNAIDSYFASTAGATETSTLAQNERAESTMSQLLENNTASTEAAATRYNNGKLVATEVVVDADWELAKKLQSTYDRENRALEAFDESSRKKSLGQKVRQPKSHRIDSFFQKK